MNLQQCLDRLAVGELANTTFVDSGKILKEKESFIISLINEALLRLYSRFVLKEDYVLIALNELTTDYVLTKEHVYSLDEVPPISSQVCLEDYNKYIIQTKEHPFKEDIIRIIRVNSPQGITVPLNDPSNPRSVFTPSYNVVQVPLLNRDSELAISYQAKHPILTEQDLQKELELSDPFFGALFAYIAYSAYSSLQSQMATATAQKYFSTYQALLDELVTFDIASNSYSQTNTKFYTNGWC